MAYSSELMCDVLGFTYDFGTRSATFFVAFDNCTNMSGAISFCTRVDPKCSEILVYGAGDAAGDVFYAKTKSGWKAFDYDRADLIKAVERDLTTRLSGLGVDIEMSDEGYAIGKSARH